MNKITKQILMKLIMKHLFILAFLVISTVFMKWNLILYCITLFLMLSYIVIDSFCIGVEYIQILMEEKLKDIDNE